MSQQRAKSTIRDVAAAAQVSVPTVSRVLNDRYGVAPATAARVRQAIQDLGYESSLAARSMRAARTGVIGLIVPDMDHAYALEVIKGISRAITGANYDLIALTSGRKAQQERGPWEQQQVSRYNGSITDGMILVVPDADEFASDYPLVAVDPHRASAAYPAVIAANREGAITAVRYLAGLGHRRIGYIAGLSYLQSAVRRRQGYDDALQELGLRLDPALIADGSFTREGGYAAARQLLSLPQPPTAIFAANDDSALGAMDAAREVGIRIPQDLALIGFDNIPESAISTPPLTTIDQSIGEMGRVALHMLMQLIDGVALDEQLVRIPTKLIERSSCAVLPPTQ